MADGWTTRMKPSEIRFSQADISKRFADGRRCEDTLTELINRETTVDDIPKIEVYKDQLYFYTNDNRRLYDHMNKTEKTPVEIPVRVVEKGSIKKQTTRNQGTTVQTRKSFEKYKEGDSPLHKTKVARRSYERQREKERKMGRFMKEQQSWDSDSETDGAGSNQFTQTKKGDESKRKNRKRTPADRGEACSVEAKLSKWEKEDNY